MATSKFTQFFGGKVAPIEPAAAFRAIDDQLTLRKVWDTTGASIVLRLKWTDADGQLVREIACNYADDMAVAEAAAKQQGEAR